MIYGSIVNFFYRHTYYSHRNPNSPWRTYVLCCCGEEYFHTHYFKFKSTEDFRYSSQCFRDFSVMFHWPSCIYVWVINKAIEAGELIERSVSILQAISEVGFTSPWIPIGRLLRWKCLDGDHITGSDSYLYLKLENSSWQAISEVGFTSPWFCLTA